MNKSRLFGAVCGCFLTLITTSANAVLWDRGGGLIYDDVLEVTWTQDVSLVRDSPDWNYDFGGLTWGDAVNWSENLTFYDSVRDVTWDDWRLPQILPLNGVSYDTSWSYDGSTDKGYNIASINSELGYMYYVNLGTQGQCDSSGTCQGGEYHFTPNTTFESGGAGGTVTSLQGLVSSPYWSGSVLDSNNSWLFGYHIGLQTTASSINGYTLAWAVRDGDVAAVPVPPALWLFGSGLLALIGIARKKRLN